MKAWYEIETCWDYAQLRVSTDSGATWTPLHTNVSDAGNENGQNPGEGITGISGSPKSCDDASGSPSWVDVTADLSAYAGQTIKLQVRYLTDGFVEGRGFEFDDLAITGPSGTILTADAEAGDTGWTLNGFRTTTGTETRFDNHYYLAEYRPYHDYDTSLMTAYNFAFFPGAPADWVETFPYQDGVVIWYWDTGQSNNNVGDHPGQGEILPVDIRPTFPHWNDGTLVRPRITSYDSALTLDPIQEITVRKEGSAITIPGGPAQPVFNDLNNYWFNCDAHACTGSHVGRYQPGWASVNVPHTGTSIMLKDISDNGFFANIQVAPAK
jgi:immune inhibitor A